MDTCYDMDEPQKHYVTWQKLDINNDILYYPIYIKFSEWANAQTESRLVIAWPGGREIESDNLMGKGSNLEVKKYSGTKIEVVVHNTVKVLNAIELDVQFKMNIGIKD